MSLGTRDRTGEDMEIKKSFSEIFSGRTPPLNVMRETAKAFY